MRIVLDVQGAQTASRARGIGRYTLAFAQAVIRNRGPHEVVLALSGLFPETIEPIRAAFDGVLPQGNIRVWHAPGPVLEGMEGNDARRGVAELLREAFLASLGADVVHVSSLFEGYGDDAVTSIGGFDAATPVSVSFYDLIPLLNPGHYLDPHPRYARYYHRKIEHLERAAVCLAISAFSRDEGMTHLPALSARFVNVSTAIEPCFQPIHVDDETAARLFRRYGIAAPFILYTGGADERKNLPRLLQAFAALPQADRAGHQLVFAGRIVPEEMHGLQQQISLLRLPRDKVCFTGYVPEDDLVRLYNLCALFVFPSWHEGFGLPALEAMACGAPVIGANTASLPEVIGLDEALFDPLDVDAIAARMHEALGNESLRTRLRAHGIQQAKKFSWDATARRAIAAWESLPAEAGRSGWRAMSARDSRLEACLAEALRDADDAAVAAVAACLAMNRQTGLERQWLVDVSAWVAPAGTLDRSGGQCELLKAWLASPPAGFRVEPVYAGEAGYRYARRLTCRLLGLDDADAPDTPMNWQRGDVFFVLAAPRPLQLVYAPFFRQLGQEGVTVRFFVQDLLPVELAEWMQSPAATMLHAEWLSMVAGSDGAVCASQAVAAACENWLTANAIGRSPYFQLSVAPLPPAADAAMDMPATAAEVDAVLHALAARPGFLCVAPLEPWCGHEQILDAFQRVWAEEDVNLVLVGLPSWKTAALAGKICLHAEYGKRLFWLHGADPANLQRLRAASACLIAGAHGDADGHVLREAGRDRHPILARDIPLYREIAGDHASYFTGNRPEALASALSAWLQRYRLDEPPGPDPVACPDIGETCRQLQQALMQDNPPRHQLLVDISELVQHDAQSGIQRVVRNILAAWLGSPRRGYRVEPVYATPERGYRYARRFACRFTGAPEAIVDDAPIDFAPGDIFLGLDLQPTVVARHREFYRFLRRQGVRVEFVVYDLLSVLMPNNFPPGAEQVFSRWLEVVTECDGAVCISQAVARELADWTSTRCAPRLRPFRIRSFHLGAESGAPAAFPAAVADDAQVMASLDKRPGFLMVGTLEPRKGHAQVLDAFDLLWHAGHDLNLVLVGKKGWMMEAFVDRLRHHPERNARLFWLDSISDADLEAVYAKSTCLIAASFGEGFGLPLIEAALHHLPVLARDISVFREVAGEHADYFSNDKAPAVLSEAILQWLRRYARGEHPRSSGMRRLSWSESAEQLMNALDPG